MCRGDADANWGITPGHPLNWLDIRPALDTGFCVLITQSTRFICRTVCRGGLQNLLGIAAAAVTESREDKDVPPIHLWSPHRAVLWSTSVIPTHTLSPGSVRGSSNVVPWPNGLERARRMLMNVALRPADARYPPVLLRGDSRGNPSFKRHPAPSDI